MLIGRHGRDPRSSKDSEVESARSACSTSGWEKVKDAMRGGC